jgi:hypothetical protein
VGAASNFPGDEIASLKGSRKVAGCIVESLLRLFVAGF